MNNTPVNQTLASIARLIEENNDFTLIMHVSPDGDSIGSACALRLALMAMGKRVQAVCDGDVPRIYRFLEGAEDIIKPNDARITSAAIAVDCADEGRMGAADEIFAQAKHTANIDHHVTNTMFAQHNAVEAHAAAAAEVVKKLIEQLDADFGANIATCLFCGLVTDTGNFAYSNTTPDTFFAAGELLQRGADNALINRAVYRSAPVSKRRMLGLGLIKAEYLHGGKVAVCKLTRADFDRFNARDEDCEGIIDNLRDVENVEIAMLMREKEPNVYKVSMRAKEYANVCAVAERYGGGGHRLAAGWLHRARRIGGACRRAYRGAYTGIITINRDTDDRRYRKHIKAAGNDVQRRCGGR